MNMNKKVYERPVMDVTDFDVEDVITASGVNPGGGSTGDPSGENPGGGNDNPNTPDSLSSYELPVDVHFN